MQNYAYSYEVNVIDDSGKALPLTKPATRIISLAPHITELLFHIEQGHKLVGIDSASDFPEEASQIEKVGNSSQINLEKIIQLKPDLVIAWYSGNTSKILARLKDFGIPIFYSEPKTLNDIEKTILQFGKITGAKKIARIKADEFKAQVALLKPEKPNHSNLPLTDSAESLRVFYQVWQSPLMTLNGEHIISEIIGRCGGRNIFYDLPIIAPQINIEAVIRENPQLIISGQGSNQSSAQKKNSLVKFWSKWSSIEAVKHQEYLFVNSDHLVRAGPRILKGAKRICADIARIKREQSARQNKE